MTKKKAERTRATKRRRKSPLFLDAAREDAKMLSAITDREIFQRVLEIVLAYWRYHQQDAFADWFESVYLCDAWDNGAFLLEPVTDQVSTHTAIRHRRSVDAPPIIREKALERDEDLLLKEPHHYKNTPLCVLFKVRSRSCLAMSESYIHINEKPVVWKVRFPKAPGGVQDLRCDSLKWSDT
jgi:hypothetical protein